MSDLHQEFALLRQQVAKLERRIEALENDDFDADHDAWIERNKDALNESIREGREAIARGEYFEGTPQELLAHILAEDLPGERQD